MVITNSSDAFEIQYTMLKLTAGWPQENSTISYRIRSITSFIITTVFAITLAIDAYSKIDNFTALSDILYIFISIITYNIKYGNLFIKEKTLHEMINLLKHSSLTSYPENLDYLMFNRIRFISSLTKVFRFSTLLCVLLMCISPVFDKQPLPYHFPYDLGKYTTLMYCFQVVSVTLVAWNNVGYDSLTASFICIGMSHLEILSEEIVQITSNLKNEELHQDLSKYVVGKLKSCLKRHVIVMQYINYIQQIFSFSTFSQFVGSAIVVCNTLFYIVLVPVGSSHFFMLINYIAIILLELFMYCWFGNEILWKSINVGEACYFSNWYYYNKNVNKYLFLIMERSKRPLKITAGKISLLSLESFTTIIRWSYSYFALLMKMYAKEK